VLFCPRFFFFFFLIFPSFRCVFLFPFFLSIDEGVNCDELAFESRYAPIVKELFSRYRKRKGISKEEMLLLIENGDAEDKQEVDNLLAALEEASVVVEFKGREKEENKEEREGFNVKERKKVKVRRRKTRRKNV